MLRLKLSKFPMVGVAAGAGIFGLTLAGAANAAVLVYQPFNYSLAQDASLAGQSVGGTGFGSATWTETKTLNTGGSASSTFNTAGLSFSGMQAGGGSATQNISAANGTTAQDSLSTPISPVAGFTSGGTLYGGFLFQVGSSTTNGDQQPMVNIGSAPATLNSIAGNLSAQFHQYGGSSNGYIAVGTKAGALAGSGLAQATTYLYLFQLTNVGGSGNQTMDAWVLSQSQFSNFSGSSSLNSGSLNAAATGSGSNEVTESGSVTGSGVNFNSSQYLTLTSWIYGHNANNVGSATYDEIRLSDSSLAEAAGAPTPEPASIGLLAAGGGAIMLLGRRRKMASRRA